MILEKRGPPETSKPEVFPMFCTCLPNLHRIRQSFSSEIWQNGRSLWRDLKPDSVFAKMSDDSLDDVSISDYDEEGGRMGWFRVGI